MKDFLPKMAEAEVKLASTLSEEGGRERLNVENLEGGQQVIPASLISTTISTSFLVNYCWNIIVNTIYIMKDIDTGG